MLGLPAILLVCLSRIPSRSCLLTASCATIAPPRNMLSQIGTRGIIAKRTEISTFYLFCHLKTRVTTRSELGRKS